MPERPESLEPLMEMHRRDMAAGLMDVLAAGLPEDAERAGARRPQTRSQPDK